MDLKKLAPYEATARALCSERGEDAFDLQLDPETGWATLRWILVAEELRRHHELAKALRRWPPTK